eukprot:3718201-Ditylum_brightwellii.AAC.1
MGKRLKPVMDIGEEQNVDDKVFLEKGGIVKVMKKGGILSIMGSDAVIGSWSVDSVTGKASSYYWPTY